MNATHLLARASARPKSDDATRAPSEPGAPASPDDPERPTPLVRLLVVLLVAVTVLGGVGTAAGFMRSPGGPDLRNEVRMLEGVAERLMLERDEARGTIDTLDAQIASLRERVAELQADGDADTAELARLEQAVTTATAQRDAALIDVAGLESELATAQEAARQALADRDEVLARFPLRIDGSLDVGELTGGYRAAVSQAYCSTGTTCRAPAIGAVTISTTAEGYLRLRMSGLLETNLFRVGDALHAVVDTTATAASCGTARPARVAVTIAAGSYRIGSNGAVDVASLQAVVTVDAPATSGCAASLAVFGATLAPA